MRGQQYRLRFRAHGVIDAVSEPVQLNACRGRSVFVEAHALCECPAGMSPTWEQVTRVSRDPEDCIPCPIGTYSAATDQLRCTPCPEGHTTLSEGADSALACKDSSDISAAAGIGPYHATLVGAVLLVYARRNMHY